MSEEKIISGEHSNQSSSQPFIAGDETKTDGKTPQQTGVTNLKDRIAASTLSGGLQQIPDGFDQQPGGDWVIINYTNPFEVLYLDFQKYKFITPQIVLNNFIILEKFWKEKAALMNSGANKVAFKNKYGDGTVENSLLKLKKAYEKIKTTEGIEQYYEEINNERLRKGEDNLKDSLEHMLMDGNASKREIQLCLERGLKYELSNEETADIITRAFDKDLFKPYGNVLGNNKLEKLLSVENWMTQPVIDETERIKKDRESLKIQILPGKYASTIEAIGTILFDDPAEAKEMIKEDLLKSAIAQKDMVLGREVGAISKGKDLNMAFLEIVYKLNKTLPFRLAENQYAKTVEELCSITFVSEQSFKQGKEHFKKGYTEIWLKETNTNAYNKFIKIRDIATNLDLAFLEFNYTFNTSLPYRFASTQIIKSVSDLYLAINKDKENWQAGISELFDDSIIVWLKTTGKASIVEKWLSIKKQYLEKKSVGLEEFLHLLNDKASYAQLVVDKEEISFPKIQSGQIISVDLVFTNTTRGYEEGTLTFSKKLEGVTLSSETIFHNAAAGINTVRVTLSVDSNKLLKGVSYKTSILLSNSTNQSLEIPVSFTIVFPKNAFIITTAKFAGLVALIFVLARLLISYSYPNWLKSSFNFFLDAGKAFNNFQNFALFGCAFFFFVACIVSGGYFLIKYLLKK